MAVCLFNGNICYASEENLVEVILYEDGDTLITTQIPKELVHDTKFREELYLEAIHSIFMYDENLYNDNYQIIPFSAKPEPTPKPDRKLISKKTWNKTELNNRLKATKDGRKIFNKIGTSSLSQLITTILDYYTKGIWSSVGRLCLTGFSEYFYVKSERWLSESIAMLAKNQIKYIEQSIYENLKSEYPKAFNIIRRVK